MKKFLLLLLSYLAIAPLHGQTPASEKEAPPAGPMLARAPDFARWNVTVKRHPFVKPGGAPDARAAARPKSAETVYAVTKTGKAYVQEYTDDLDRKWVMWTWDKISATIWPETGAVILQCNIAGLVAPDYTKSDFPTVGWVSESNFLKTTQYNGKKCLIFSQGAMPADNESSAPSTKIRAASGQTGHTESADTAAVTSHKTIQNAVIDFDTRLPLYAEDAKGTYTFAYQQPPTEMLQIPEQIQKAVKRQVQVNTDLSHPVPRGY